MNIGIVCYPSIGGSGIVATELGKALSRRGYRVHFFSYDVPHKLGEGDEQFHFHHVDVPLYPLFRFPPYTLALATSIYNVFCEDPLDILHVHYAVPHSTSALLAKQMICSKAQERLKVVTTLHGTDTELVGLMPSYKPVVEYSLNWSDSVTAVSDSLRRSTRNQFDIQNDIHVIHNPIDTDLYSPRPDKAYNSGVKTVVHISNFRPVKRIVDVIKTFDLIASSMPARLCLVGDGPDRFSAEEWVVRLGIQDKVEFVGPVQDVSTYLKDADLLLSTSENESFGLTIAEAMSCGVPVVATRVGGVPEVVEDGVTGHLAALGDIQCLAQGAIRILSNRKTFEAFSKAGRERVLKHFTTGIISKQYEALYEETMASTSNPCPSFDKNGSGKTKSLPDTMVDEMWKE